MAKVLHIDVEEPLATDDTDNIQQEVSIRIMETGESVFTITLYPVVALKTVLGLYKLPAVLNADLVAEVKEELDVSHDQSGFSATFLTGAFVTI